MKRIVCLLLPLVIVLTTILSAQWTAVAAEHHLIVFSSVRDDGSLTRDDITRQCQSAGLDETDVFSAACDRSVSMIGESAFENRSLLSKITIPVSVISIGARAFYGSALAEIHIPDSVQSIGADAFGRDGSAITIVANHNSHAWAYAKEHGLPVRVPGRSVLSALQENPVEETLIIGSTLSLPVNKDTVPDIRPLFRWVSDNPAVAAVSDRGTVTALSVGTAAIGVETLSGLLAVGEITVQAAPVKVTAVTFRNAPGRMTKGGALTLKTTVTPTEATNQKLRWTTSDKSVAKVDQNGKITAAAPGQAVITATAKDGSGKKARCTVTVEAYVTLKVGKTMAIQNGVRTTVDNTGAKPFKVQGKTMLPLRFLGEKLGGRVKYTSDASPITMTFGNKTVSFTLGKTLMRVTSGRHVKTVRLETPAQKRNGRTYIPLRAIGQALGFTVYYESAEERIVVSSASMSSSVRKARLAEYRKAERADFDEFVNRAIRYAEQQPRYPVKNGKTVYGALFGNSYAAWCTEFVLWCFYQAEKELGTSYIGAVYPWRNSSGGCVSWFSARGRLHYRSSGYVPKRGDMIFYNYGTGGSTDHTGLVTGINQKGGVTYVQTIEGNIPGDSPKQIRTLTLPLDSKKIVCYGSAIAS